MPTFLETSAITHQMAAFLKALVGLRAEPVGFQSPQSARTGKPQEKPAVQAKAEQKHTENMAQPDTGPAPQTVGLEVKSFTPPGPDWDCIEQPELHENIRQGTYRFNPERAEQREEEAHRTLAALNRWRNEEPET